MVLREDNPDATITDGDKISWLDVSDSDNDKNTTAALLSAYLDQKSGSITNKTIPDLKWKEPVRVATTVNGALATAYENADVVDGITLATGDRILLKDQTAGAENGIYTVEASGAPTRAIDWDGGTEAEGAIVLAREGTANAAKAWKVDTVGTITIGTTVIVITQFGGGDPDPDGWTIVPKLSDQTINNDAVAQDDDDLFFTVDANSVYVAQAYLRIISDPTADIRDTWDVPAGTGGNFAESAVNGGMQGITFIHTQNTVAGQGTYQGLYIIVETAGTAGTVTLQWAQQTAQALDCTVALGSFLMWRKLS